MKKIIVPTDFSDQAAQALKFAVDIATKSKGEVLLAHVVDLPMLKDSILSPSIYVDDSIVRESTTKAQKGFDKALAKHANSGVKIKTTVEYGNPSMSIISLIESKKADLVVMGTKGATGLKEIFVGSNTEKVVRGARVPVISLPKASKIESVKNIVFPNSLREDDESLALQIKTMQHFFNAALHIVYINTPTFFKRDHETLGKLHNYVKRHMFKNYTIQVYNDYTEQDGTMNFASDVKADIIALGTHGRHGLAHLLSGSIAEDMVNHVNCPIWTFRIG